MNIKLVLDLAAGAAGDRRASTRAMALQRLQVMYDEELQKHDYPFLVREWSGTVPGGTGQLELPAGFRSFLSGTIMDGDTVVPELVPAELARYEREMVANGVEDLRASIGYGPSRHNPNLTAPLLLLRPTPTDDKALTARIRLGSDVLRDDAACEPIISPTMHHGVLLTGALAIYYELSEQFDLMREKQARWEAGWLWIKRQHNMERGQDTGDAFEVDPNWWPREGVA